MNRTLVRDNRAFLIRATRFLAGEAGVDDDRTRFVAADVTRPDAVLADETLRSAPDFDRPLALHHVGTLQRLEDHERPAELMAAYLDASPRGSFVVLSHFFNPGAENPELAEAALALERLFRNGPLRSGAGSPTARGSPGSSPAWSWSSPAWSSPAWSSSVTGGRRDPG